MLAALKAVVSLAMGGTRLQHRHHLLSFRSMIYLSALQKRKDQHCDDQWANDKSDCHGRLFARYSITNNNSTNAWRCYYEESLTGDRLRYDTETATNCYHEDDGLKLEYFDDEGDSLL